MTLWRAKVGAAAIVLVSLAVTTQGQDRESCEDPLERLRGLFRGAADEAASVAEAEGQEQRRRYDVERRQEELENCLRFPFFDLPPDGRDGTCTSQQFDYEHAVSDHNQAVQRLDREVVAFNGRLQRLPREWRSVSSACDAQGTAIAGNGFCELVRGYVGSLPNSLLMGVCRDRLSEEQCRSCLNRRP